MRRRLHHLIVLLLCGFYALSALEVSVGDYVNEFGDSYDTYVSATPETASEVAAVKDCPALTPALRYTFRFLTARFPEQRPVGSFFSAPPSSPRIRLYVLHSVWLI